jgi:hypothetical protein
MPTEFAWFEGPLNTLLKGRTGPVARDCERRGLRVEARAKQNASGPPHGNWNGTQYASAPGGGPGVRTGAGRSSITHALGSDARGVYCDVGAGMYYMGILELRSNAPYPWLLRSLSAAAG